MSSLLLNTLWVGAELGRLERLCLSSAVAVGHDVNLFTYDPIDCIPPGVRRYDARDILPRHLMMQYAYNGSYALGSDLFRYELLNLGAGCWIDTDVFFLRAIEKAPFIFGWEDLRSINSAVLHIDSEEPLLQDLRSFARNSPVVPPWWSASEQRLQREQARPVSRLPWGTIGPKALTYFAQQRGVTHWAQPRDVFYPIDWRQARSVLDPGADIFSAITPNTRTIHLWSHLIEDLKDAPDPNSLLGALYSGKFTPRP